MNKVTAKTEWSATGPGKSIVMDKYWRAYFLDMSAMCERRWMRPSEHQNDDERGEQNARAQ